MKTLAEHNEELVLQKHQLLAKLDAERNQVGLILAAILRQTNRKSITLKPENLTVPGVQIDHLEGGSIKVSFQE